MSDLVDLKTCHENHFWKCGIVHPEFVFLGQTGNRSRVLLQNFESFDGGHRGKATGYVGFEKSDSSYRHCIILLNSPHMQVSCKNQHGIASAPTLFAGFRICGLSSFLQSVRPFEDYHFKTVIHTQRET